MKRIAFPALSAGLDGLLSPHFGHVGSFTIIEYDEVSKKIIKVESANNASHQQGGCMAPVMVIKNAGADEVVLGGIGMRPLMFFLQVGIKHMQALKERSKRTLKPLSTKNYRK